MIPIVLDIGGIRVAGELLETPPARALAARLPLELAMDRWGDEYYGSLGAPLGSFPGARVELLEVGDLAYWEPGNALCLFFGLTPASTGSKPQAASPVFPVGRAEADWAAVRALGRRITVRVGSQSGS
jgi:hypothetical protein